MALSAKSVGMATSMKCHEWLRAIGVMLRRTMNSVLPPDDSTIGYVA
jgi:hypothetical protein